jgi:predicted TPR repeat methyltransferase
MTTEYTEVFQDTDAVEKYETVTYAPGSYASVINERQRAYLRSVVRRHFGATKPVQHDFACGTGRAIRNMHGLVRAAHGYDTSTAMMAKAAEVGSHAEWHQVAPDGPVPTPVETAGPKIVTMFRLLLNVGDDVRNRAVAFAAKALPTPRSGLLVVENHGSTDSLRHLGARRHSGKRWFAELSHDEVAALFQRHGFELVERRGFSMVSQSAYDKAAVRPFARGLDAVLTRVPGSGGYSVNVVYVARRAAR